MYYGIMGKSKITIDRINDLLRQRDWSAAELSRAAGVSEGAISNLLSGKRKQPRADTIASIAKALETSTDYLMGLTNDPAPREVRLDEEIYQLIQVAKTLRPHRMADLIAIAETYRDTKQNSRQLMAAVLEAIADEGGIEQRDRLIAFMESATPGDGGLFGSGRTSAGDEGE